MPTCNSCYKTLSDFRELALHIRDSKTGHRKGKKWAAKYLLRVKALDKKVTNQNRPERTPMTEEQKEAKKSTIREVSGEYHSVLCTCPACNHGHEQQIEVEYLESTDQWRSQSGNPMILCGNCRGVR